MMQVLQKQIAEGIKGKNIVIFVYTLLMVYVLKVASAPTTTAYPHRKTTPGTVPDLTLTLAH